MPKISADTVAAHREGQLRAILDAATALVHETGSLPGLGQVAARAGLARTSVYQYYPSRADLLSALIDEELPAWEAHLGTAMNQFQNPRERIWAWFTANLAMFTGGHHAMGTSLGEQKDDPVVDDHSELMHARLRTLLTTEITRLGVERPDVVAELLDAQLHAVGKLIAAGRLDADSAQAQLWLTVGPFLDAAG